MPPLGRVFLGLVTLPPASAKRAPACRLAPSAESGGGRSGMADISEAVRATALPCPNTHKMPLSAARVSCHGRPRPSARRWGRKIGSIDLDWASLSSHWPRMPPFDRFPTLRKIASEVQLPFMRLVLVSESESRNPVAHSIAALLERYPQSKL
jgi:hypothetical protein